MVWPALYLEKRLLAWWVIGFGLLVEWRAVHYLTGRSWRGSVWPTLAMNLASTIVGLVLIPLAGFGWEFFPGTLLYKIFDVGTFNPGTWIATLVFAVLINTSIEALVLKRVFKTRFPKDGFLVLALANAVSVGAAMVSIMVAPPPI